MNEVFKIKKISSYLASFDIDDEHIAWFPKRKHKKWENILSEDGRVFYEKPKDPKDKDTVPDENHIFRYTFYQEKERSGYRFIGMFKYKDVAPDKTRVYELVSDEVDIVAERPLMVVCRVAYMKYYDGITQDDVPTNGGSYVTDNQDAYEKNNFHKNDDGNCYIFVETKHRASKKNGNQAALSIVIENLDSDYKGKECIKGVRVVLVALSPELKENVVVGWYDNATVFRNRVVEGDRVYMMKSSSTDAHLIPETDRRFVVPRAAGNDFGIGQNNFWYIQNYPKARKFELKLNDYLNSTIAD